MDLNHEITKYVDKLYSAALRKTGDSYAAEELSQEVWLAALQALDKGKEPENLWAWLLAVLSNKYCDRLRRQYNEPVISYDQIPLELPEKPDDTEQSSEMLELIRQELGHLAKMHREVMFRYYLRGENVENIAQALDLPAGTVKSRLNTGRNQVKKGIANMENYAVNSIAPDILYISCSGNIGNNNEPFSLVAHSDVLAQNILILAYAKPVTPTELSKAMGVPSAFLEPVLERLINGELMKRTEGGKVYTDFIIYTDKDRNATLEKQLALAKRDFSVFWEELSEALEKLRAQAYYQRQSLQAKEKLELHFCIKILLNAYIAVRDEITGSMPFSEYPYRKDGGRWFAMGNQYAYGKERKDDEPFMKYGISGEWLTGGIRNYMGAASLELRGYDTVLGGYPQSPMNAEYVKWLYEVHAGIHPTDSGVGSGIPEATGEFVEAGILGREETLVLNIPVLTLEELQAECALAKEYTGRIYTRVRDNMLPVLREGGVKLPAHLKSVPQWQRYMLCGDSIPMAVIHEAMERGLLFADAAHPIPSVMLIVEKQ